MSAHPRLLAYLVLALLLAGGIWALVSQGAQAGRPPADAPLAEPQGAPLPPAPAWRPLPPPPVSDLDPALWTQLAGLREDPEAEDGLVWPEGLRERLGKRVKLFAAAWPIAQETGPKGAAALELRVPADALLVMPPDDAGRDRVLLRLAEPLVPPSHRAWAITVEGTLQAFTDDRYGYDFVLEARTAHIWYRTGSDTWTRQEREARTAGWRLGN